MTAKNKTEKLSDSTKTLWESMAKKNNSFMRSN